jgi:hypothetical protein
MRVLDCVALLSELLTAAGVGTAGLSAQLETKAYVGRICCNSK